MEKKKFYLTTPIYYPSDKLHIGHIQSIPALFHSERPL